MPKQLTISFCLLLLLAALPRNASAQLDTCYRLMEAYSTSASDRYQRTSRLFLDLSYAFCVDTTDSTPVPAHVLRTDSSFYLSASGIEAWKNYCFEVIRAIYKNENRRAVVRPISGRVYDADDRQRFLKAASMQGADSSKLPLFNIADSLWGDTARSLSDAKIATVATQIVDLIVDSTDLQAQKTAATLLDTIHKVKKLYERKYCIGFRNRNIIEYFVAGTFETFIAKKQRRLLSPPSLFELILLSKPMMTAGSGSLFNNGADSNNIYVLIPMAGVDRFTNNYKQYFGASVFSAVPLSAKPYKNAYWGVEAHFSNKALIGYGWKIPDFSMQKVFVTIPLVSGWGWFD